MTDKVAELTAKVAEQKRVIRDLMGQLEFYRGFMPQHSEVHTPPPGYWVDGHPDPDTNRFYMGHLIDGSLLVISAHDDRVSAIAAANEHFNNMKGK